jgi:hypothetical protein
MSKCFGQGCGGHSGHVRAGLKRGIYYMFKVQLRARLGVPSGGKG